MADSSFQIIETSTWEVLSVEEMGSKPKFWLLDPAGTKWLFKHRHRPNVGDDWAEKIAAEVAHALEIPHATVELARFQEKTGIISKDLVGSIESSELVLGNNLLVEADPNYPLKDRYHVADHTIDRVFAAIGADFIGLPEDCPKDSAIRSPLDLFVGYLMLDALVGNTDRHHENWAILQLPPIGEQRRAVLCPTFDHASSLGHLLTDDEREKRLRTKDRGYSVDAYVRKGRSALYRQQGDPKPMSLLDAFREATFRRPEAAKFWREKLIRLDAGILDEIILQVPDDLMTEYAKKFATAAMSCNLTNLLAGTS